VKPNIEELAQINPNLPQGDFIACLDYLSRNGIQLPAASGGARGLAVRFQGESWLAVPPVVEVKSNIGAGDAALAGLIWGFGQGLSARELARSASAFGTACVMQEGTGMGDRNLIFKLMKETKMVRLD
jgi:1-phosphofructokinase